MTTDEKCFCGNKFTFEQCCKPILDGEVEAINAEILMRSRFSAYVIKNYQYILQTYASTQRAKLSVSELLDSAQDTQWLALQVITHLPHEKTAQVEFKATYQVGNHYYVMHELSDFIFEGGKWFYINGITKKGAGEFAPERNSQCLCNSGKKFKKCCGK